MLHVLNSRLLHWTRPIRLRIQHHTTAMASASNMPKNMNGVQITSPGGPEAFRYRTDLPVPTPQDGEVLVKNDFVGINYVDIYWRIGMMGHGPNGILGREGEGTVVSTGGGDVNGLKIGDRVAWLALGAYAEYTAVPAWLAQPVPSAVEPGVAAASLLQGLTALVLTHRVYEVKEGDWVLVHAAAGGMGLWLCQLAKALGAKVIGTAGTAEKLQFARDHGADFTVDYTHNENLVREILDITSGRGVDVVYDGVGKDQAENNLDVVAIDGTIVTYGVASGIPTPASPTRLAAKGIKVVGPGESALMRQVGTPQDFRRWATMLFGLVTAGKVSVKIHGVYPLSEVAKAHEDLEGRRTTGKLLVKI